MKKTMKVNVGGHTVTLETGWLAKQAGGSMVVSCGETVVLVTSVTTDYIREGIDFLPLTVDFQEKAYAAGNIPGNFFRREIGRPSERETLTSRLIDRPIRPLFPKGFYYETQIIANVLSADLTNDPDVLALVGASAALHISDAPFAGPLAAVRVGRLNREFVVNPLSEQMLESDLDLIVAGTREGVVMVESGSRFLRETEVLDAIYFGHEAMQPLLDAQEELRELTGVPKREVTIPAKDEELRTRVRELAGEKLTSAVKTPGKMERSKRVSEVRDEIFNALGEGFSEEQLDELSAATSDVEREIVRRMVLDTGQRIDGRDLKDIRDITCEAHMLPRVHGSSIFTRGETQALATATLGSRMDEQRIERLSGQTWRKFMLHYNFPPFCVGEARFLRGPSRRDIGHGALARRAIMPVLPDFEEFPYTIRVVSEVLESNGSSSMATVCATSMALMDAGIPINEPVAGIAMGMVSDGDRVAVLSDILGDEDHLGDMDFKVSGTKEGITALQMDIKVKSLPKEVLGRALEQARDARLHILEKMNQVIAKARPELSPWAPRIITLDVNPEKIKDIIGPGGRVIRQIVADTGVKIDVDDSGRVTIVSVDMNAAKQAEEIVLGLVEEAEVGKLYLAKVRKVTDFGAFAEILPGTDGLIHISQLDATRVNKVTDVVREGDEVLVKVLAIDHEGKIRLSRKAALGKSLADNQSD